MTADEIGSRLREPLPIDEVQWKPQSVKGNRALAVAYIDARTVQDRLDSVLGVSGWQDDYNILNDGCVVCQLRIKVDGEWVSRSDTGSPSEQPDGGDRLKAAFSDALKRAAVKFGIGRYLYSLPLQWCDYDPAKRQFTQTPQLPDWARPHRKPNPAPVAPPSQPRADNPQPTNGHGHANGTDKTKPPRAAKDNMQGRAEIAQWIGGTKNQTELNTIKEEFKKAAANGQFSQADVDSIVSMIQQRERQIRETSP